MTDDRTPADLRAEADTLEARVKELREEANARERFAAGRRLCEAQTKAGRPCRNEAVPGLPYCNQHRPGGPVTWMNRGAR